MGGSGILASTFTGGWYQLVAGRLTLGLGVGLASMATPLYMAEVTPAQWRGKCMLRFLQTRNDTILVVRPVIQ